MKMSQWIPVSILQGVRWLTVTWSDTNEGYSKKLDWTLAWVMCGPLLQSAKYIRYLFQMFCLEGWLLLSVSNHIIQKLSGLLHPTSKKRIVTRLVKVGLVYFYVAIVNSVLYALPSSSELVKCNSKLKAYPKHWNKKKINYHNCYFLFLWGIGPKIKGTPTGKR